MPIYDASFILLRMELWPRSRLANVNQNAADLIRGGSCIVDPLGNVLVEPDFTGEAIRIAEIDRCIIARGKYDFDMVGHYARPDVFQLPVDTRPKPPVTLMRPPATLIGGKADTERGLQEAEVCSD